MFRKVIAIVLLVSLIGVTSIAPSDAGFFKKHKKIKTEEIQEKEEKKVLIVEIFASWCPGCKNIQPTLDQLIKEVPDISFIVLDVSTPSKAQDSANLANELGITDFYLANKSKTATVAVVIPTTHETISIFENNNDLAEYKSAIEKARTKEKAIVGNPPI